MRIARALQPLFARSEAFRVRERLQTDSIRESSLDFVLMMLARHRVEFDPLVRVDGEDALPSPASATPTVIVLPHTMLSSMLPRVLRDRGISLVGISADPLKVAGTRDDARILVPSGKLLVTVRELLRNGETVSAMIDRGERERRTVSVMTKRGEFHISTALLDLGLQCRARILFASAMLDEQWNVVFTIVAPKQDEETTLADVVGEFGAFIDTYVHRA